MGKTLSAVLLTLTVCATAPEARVTREIQTEYDKLAAAFDRQDIDAVLSFRLPTFETFGPAGQHNDASQMAEYTRNWLLVQNKPPISSKFTIQSIELRSDKEAAVKVLQRVSRHQEREGKLVRVEHEVVQRETWNRTPQGWKLRMVDQIDMANRKRWVDGKLQTNP